MKSNIVFKLLVLGTLLNTKLFAQEFSFPIYFQDALGNRDTVILGFDANATDSVNGSFGEINRISSPWNPNLDVRVTNEYSSRFMNSTPGSYHLKKAIDLKNCYDAVTKKNSLEIVSSNWPITASWDSTLFIGACKEGSFFTSIHPGAWWDATTGESDLGRVLFSQSSSVTFTRNFGNSIDQMSSYLSGNDSVSVFWYGLGDSSLIVTGIEQTYNGRDLTIYPNPSKGEIALTFPLTNESLNVQVIDLTGKTLSSMTTSPSINSCQLDLSAFKDGFYMIRVSGSQYSSSKRLLLITE